MFGGKAVSFLGVSLSAQVQESACFSSQRLTERSASLGAVRAAVPRLLASKFGFLDADLGRNSERISQNAILFNVEYSLPIQNPLRGETTSQAVNEVYLRFVGSGQQRKPPKLVSFICACFRVPGSSGDTP